ncbi:MAG: hypothetical protein U5K79_12925 [Cyclobacteriaceae bacterium]|nr:hypothetical protein [Cyclobacteriaceae bacterium]
MKNPWFLFPGIPVLLVTFLLSIFAVVNAFGTRVVSYQSVTIISSEKSDAVEKRVANLLRERLMEKNHISVEITDGKVRHESGNLTILFGRPDHNEMILDKFQKLRIPPLTDLAPGAEGFLLRWADADVLMVAGYDDRGCLYAVGELLRQIQPEIHQISISSDLHIRTAPAFEIRGTQYGQSGVALNLAKVRPWTETETQRVILDYALAGANIFNVEPGPMFHFIKSYGLMTQGEFGANTAAEVENKEWMASESIGRNGYVCLSVKDAREHMLKKCDAYFRASPTFDLIKFQGGDGGGCECDRCDPYGLTFIKLVEEMAAIIRKYHPETRIYFTNQKFDNADDNAIFDYLQEKPRDWLWAWGYGPGSDATTWQPGHRQTHRMDLFRYPGFGPYGLYPQEILHQLPPQQKLVFYNEITHWKYAQHAYIQMYPRPDKNGDHPPQWSHEIYERRPDQYLTMVYNRLTFYAWPRNYHRVFNDLMRYGIGDITHSSGHHDHFNQWMWQRLLWAPRTSVEDVVDEYCRTWFGKEAAPFMAQAIFQLEENLEEIPGLPLPEKVGILNYYNLVKKAGEVMPSLLMENNWLWRMFMQKGALDRYIQLSVIQQMDIRQKIEYEVTTILQTGMKDNQIQDLIKILEIGPPETGEMKALREEAERLGEESNTYFGDRNDGIFNLKHDFIGLGWLKRQLERAEAASPKNRQELLTMIVDYENPGAGGYYDNFGTANPAPNAVFGYPYDHGQPYVAAMLSESNKPSQRSMHFTQDESQGVTIEYLDLDPKASYKIRFTLVRPWYQERYAMRMNQHSETIYADDIPLVENLEVPLHMSDFFTFDIPAKATKDGTLTIRFEKARDVANGDRVAVEQWRNSGGWGTIVSEAWLMKK